MNPAWQQFLQSRGATFADGRVAHFGDPAAELQATQGGTVLCDLSHNGLLVFEGEDAATFLHGQLTADIKKLAADASRYGGYCTPKGRLLATFLIWQNQGAYFLQLPATLAPATLKRLTMYILRSKVQAKDASGDYALLGVAGGAAQTLIESAIGLAPQAQHGVLHHSRASVLRLPGERYQIAVASDKAPALWEALSQKAKPAGAPCWDLLEIRAGIPTVTPATQEAFVPQMVNLDAIGGVSFQKGCYPGQEIVARTQYLGKLKRRMFLAHLENPAAPQAGDELFSADMAEQACGTVVNAAPAPSGGYDLLAVIQIGSAETNMLHWKALDGPALELLDLPYPLA